MAIGEGVEDSGLLVGEDHFCWRGSTRRCRGRFASSPGQGRDGRQPYLNLLCFSEFSSWDFSCSEQEKDLW
jgi:hypothetical protein